MTTLLSSHFFTVVSSQRTVRAPASPSSLPSSSNPQSSSSAIQSQYTYFEDVNSEKFNHLTINEFTGQVYVGGVNRIYQLKPNLEMETFVEMGPKDDSVDCPVTRLCDTITKRPTDYYNKVLVIDYPQSRLISCGSLFQGICSIHRLDNVTIMETPAQESVVANNATASTVAFIAPGPPKLSRVHVLYVGVTFTGNGPYRSDVPAVSSRSLDNPSIFSTAATGITTGTRLHINSLAKERYPISYIYGFSARGFSYFLTVQKKNSESVRPFVSKLVRVCQKDVNYYSYTEVPLVCRSPEDGIDYNLAQAAFVGKPGSELAVSLGITAQDEVLFVVFAKSHDDQDVFNRPSKNSAVCVYALSAIHRKFTQNIQHCFNGNGNQGLDFVTVSMPCVLTVSQLFSYFSTLIFQLHVTNAFYIIVSHSMTLDVRE
jgi:plexin A